EIELVDADVAAEGAAAELVGFCRKRLGGLEVLINNAAIKRVGDPVAYAVEDFDRVMAVNLKGPFLLAQEAVKQFREQASPGVILNVASVHDTKPLASDIGYAMSKAALSMMTKTLAVATGPEGIRVHGV